MSGVTRGTPLDRMLRPVHRWVWGDLDRRVRKLLAFAEVETDGGRDILRAAEVTPDPLLRRLYLEHAIDELRHGDLFRQRGAALLRARPRSTRPVRRQPAPGGHGLDDLSIEGEPDHRLLAFLHVAEKAAAGRFAIYREVVDDDPPTRAIFEEILRDEVFHMNYTYTQLDAHLAAVVPAAGLACARASRLWKRYLRVAAAVAGVIGSALSDRSCISSCCRPFAWLARRASAREPSAGTPISRTRRDASRRASTDMKILGISAHYHDSAAALVVDGVPVCAVQEERLSRRKNDAAFPTRRHRMVPGSGGLDPADLDAVVFYERSMLKFERILTCALRAFPRLLAVVSPRHQELARRKGLGARHHLVASRRAARRRSCSPTITPRTRPRPFSRRRPARRDPDGRRRRRVGDAHGRPRRAAPDGATDITLRPRNPVSALARHAVFDVHGLSRLRGERGRVQGDGTGRLRAADDGRRRCAS